MNEIEKNYVEQKYIVWLSEGILKNIVMLFCEFKRKIEKKIES